MAAVDLGIPSLRTAARSASATAEDARSAVPGTPEQARSSDRPAVPELVDRYGRVATDLRVSLIDKCNLRCSYCMPAEGVPWLGRSELLTAVELGQLMQVAVEDLGVRTVRFTGGEPLLRPDLAEILAATNALNPQPAMSLTTNGIGLADRAADLREAGLTRVNVSLDTVDEATFRTITHRDRLPEVLTGLAGAQAAGLQPVKVNAVLLRGVNDLQAPELLRFCIQRGYQLRFIEQMPLDPQGGWDRDHMITAAEILELLSQEFTLTPDPSERGSAPAERWLVDGGPATVGVIATVTRPFCQACDRTRLTADGQLRSCLFSQTETDLRTPLRAGASNAELAELWRETMWTKAAAHGVDSPANAASFGRPSRPMSAIGG